MVNEFRFDPLVAVPAIPPLLRYEGVSPDEPSYYIVQFKDRVAPAMKRDLEAAGAVLLHYVNYNAFVVRADGRTIERAMQLPLVRWAGLFHPAYKLSPRLAQEYDAVLNEAVERNVGRAPGAPGGPSRIDTTERIPVHVLTMEKSRIANVAGAVAALGGKGLVTSDRGLGGMVRAEVPRPVLERLAREPGVLWIDREVPSYVSNDIARWVIQSADAAGFATPVHAHGLFGTGQTVTIGDSGIDFQHNAFEDPNVPAPGPGHRKVTDYYIPAGAQGDGSDNGSFNHGTHVSGTVAGDDGTWHFYDGDPNGSTLGGGPHDGQAFDAAIQVQDISNDPSGVFVYPPSDFHDLFRLARDRGSWIHTNSWGGCCSYYVPQTAQTDDFIWNNPNFTILFAAGNAGPGSRTINQQAVAKNVITVGGAGNGAKRDDLMFCSSRATYCTSRGPAADGRQKPDVMAPGEDIWSARGCDPGGECDDYWQLTGTSMATPTTAGAATLVRQYYMDGWYPSGERRAADGFTPSAALIKATLINSAAEMNGVEAYANGETRYPNNNQGWGRILLGDALFFQGGPRDLVIDDNTAGVVRDQTATYQLPVRNSSAPVEITLVWSDAPGNPVTTPNLVNDLDLVVAAPDGTAYRGNRYFGMNPGGSEPNPVVLDCPAKNKAGDCLNNVESVLVRSNVQIGAWTVTVTGYDVPVGQGIDNRQPYALVMTSGRSPKTGVVQLDRTAYRSSVVAEVRISDSDLNLNPGARDSAVVELTSDTETIAERLTLLETGVATAVFAGAIQLDGVSAPVAGDGRLEVRNHDTIRAAYLDADDGLGGSGYVFDTATIDDDPPVISGVRASSVRIDTATITWTTDQVSDSVIRYGTSLPPALTASSSRSVTSHSIDLAGLQDDTTYYYSVQSSDAQGNTGTDDNSAVYYQFTTFKGPVPPVSDYQTGPGTILQGSYLDTRTSDDVWEVLKEGKVGSKSRLTHVWRFDGIPVGLWHSLQVEGHRPANAEGDNFAFSFSIDGITFGDINTLSWATDLDPYLGWQFGSGSLSGTLYIRVQDTVADGATLDTVSIDRLAIYTEPADPCPDTDGDGYASSCTACMNSLCPLLDCNDSDPLSSPGRTEGPANDPTCSDQRDNDCDSLTDGGDGGCSSGATIEVTAAADQQTGPGSIIQGSYLDTRTLNDAYEGLSESLQGAKSRLTHVWRFDSVPAGLSHALRVNGARPDNVEGDDFQLAYSNDGTNFASITGALINSNVFATHDYTFGTGALSGTLYIRVQDTKASGNRLDRVYVDLLAIRTSGGQPACADADADGYTPSCSNCSNVFCPAIDCADADPLVNPGRTEGPVGDPTCSDGKDNDCDTKVDGTDSGCSPTTQDRLNPNGDFGIMQWRRASSGSTAFNYEVIHEGFPSNDGVDYVFIPTTEPNSDHIDRYDLTASAAMGAGSRTTTLSVDVRAKSQLAQRQDTFPIGITLIVDGLEQTETVLNVQGDDLWHTLTFANPNWNNKSWTKAQVDGMQVKVRGTVNRGGKAHAVSLWVSTVQVTANAQIP